MFSNIINIFQAPLLQPTPAPRPEGADICGNVNFPKPILVLNYKIIPNENIHNISLNVDIETSKVIETETRQQAENKRWFSERKERITSSDFGKIMKRKKEINDTFLKSLFEKKPFTAASTSYGIANEKTAKQMYINKTGNHIHEIGLVVNPAFPYLGASPDGKVCDKSITGIIEIKCPYTVRDNTLQEACVAEDFFLQLSGANFQLKTCHPHWYQVQGQLLITGAPFCDFITYTRKSFNVERIFPCNDTMLKLNSALHDMYISHCVPFLTHS